MKFNPRPTKFSIKLISHPNGGFLTLEAQKSRDKT